MEIRMLPANLKMIYPLEWESDKGRKPITTMDRKYDNEPSSLIHKVHCYFSLPATNDTSSAKKKKKKCYLAKTMTTCFSSLAQLEGKDVVQDS